MSTFLRIAFDLDETLGVPLTDGRNIVGWRLRPGATELLDRLQTQYTLVLWTVSPRRYLDKALSFGLSRWFTDTYSYDELPCVWKDVRRIDAICLIDDDVRQQKFAAREKMENQYIIVPAYGSPADTADPRAWVRVVESILELDG